MRLVPGIVAALVLAAVAGPRLAHADVKQECLAAADQGQQLRDDNKYRRARESFVTCSRDVCPGAVMKLCTKWLGELDHAMPSVVLAVRDERGGDVTDAHVTLDGAPLTDRLDGKAILIDPGEHVVRVERAGSETLEQKVVVRANEQLRAVTLTLRASAAPPSSTTVSAPPPGADVGTTKPAHGFFTARNVTAISLLGLVVVATGGAIYFGAQSKSEADTAAGFRTTNPSSACTHTTNATCQQWSDAVDNQNRDATLNVVLFIAGGALAGGALATWLFWPNDKPRDAAWVTPAVGPGRAGVAFGARF